MRILKTYGFSLLLVGSIAAGMALGLLAPATARALRPLGDLFLNLIFMVIVPLVFFTISSSIASMAGTGKVTRISLAMLFVFLMTSVVAAVTGLLFMLVAHPSPGAGIELTQPPQQEVPSVFAQIVATFTVPDFPELLSRRAMLPLIVFATAVGVATTRLGEKGEAFARVLSSGAQVFTRLIGYVMLVAPVGLFAYFAATVVDTGEQIATAYLGVFWAYYIFAAVYFVVGFSIYAFAAGKTRGVRRFWANMLKPSLTAAGTCSSMATMPINMEASLNMGVPREVRDVVIPLGAAVHKDGSVIGGVVKVLFLLSVFHQDLDATTLALVVGTAVLVGVVMGAIPSGGMIGEMLILSVFGFPLEALPLIAIISVIIDPAATLLNATGDNVAAMLVTRLTDGDIWSQRRAPTEAPARQDAPNPESALNPGAPR
jgi:Na+/H+-dicarboxylate symporter